MADALDLGLVLAGLPVAPDLHEHVVLDDVSVGQDAQASQGLDDRARADRGRDSLGLPGLVVVGGVRDRVHLDDGTEELAPNARFHDRASLSHFGLE